ncbi:glycogen debranching protein GlgX [Citricoccus sp. SGAir0253]|uniref:glycogen debranching protein GlgX n=1 Tax=Citricoccus sp. SGAir0253 TaxID=2567881 RepID=UPI0010CD529E|nr:glycogen debranching protein GlgX [Citricoccus sp. SGAir0253]QCU78810.1 glycogen debranching protein GlgX [Citricoccus sp. SGAir0253]
MASLPTASVPAPLHHVTGHRSRPFPLGIADCVPGVVDVPGAVNVAVYAPGQEALDVVYTGPGFPVDAVPTAADLQRAPLFDVTDRVHHGTVPGIGHGSLYAFVPRDRRIPGLSRTGRPTSGKERALPQLLLDPYGDAVVERGGRYWSVRVPRDFDWSGVQRPHVPLRDTIVYEAHVIGQTRLHPGIPEELRGTYAGLAHPVMVRYLQELGITAVELLPVHHHRDEDHLQDKGLVNYWGYNSVSFFAPHPGYATAAARAGGPKAIQDEFKGMVKLLHEAGLEVILDVVYNHTAEEGPGGPTFCWRGLGERQYYRHDASGGYLDTTGCGNALDFTDPQVVRMTLDSLRRWVTDFQVDGFRFDLAVTMCRDEAHHFTSRHPFLVAAQADPVLAGTKLIAEPWDVAVGGWQTGHFPPGWSDWNDRFRDVVRDFWVADRGAMEHGGSGGSTARLADCLAGSAGLFAGSGRSALASVNLVTAHDGFTLRDLVSYNEKHNEANGEDNRDGNSHNRSYNHGVEGPTEDEAIRDARAQTARNLMATLLVSLGVPMITAGDEIGRTQRGNNNAYCQDNEISWTDWDLEERQQRMLATTRRLIAIRKEFLAGQPYSYPSREPGYLMWFSDRGLPMTPDDWSDPSRRLLQLLIGVPGGRSTGLIVFNGALDRTSFRLPTPESVRGVMDDAGSALQSFELQLATCRHGDRRRGAQFSPGDRDTIEGNSITLYSV